MTLIPVLPNVANPIFVGAWINRENSAEPSWDFTEFSTDGGETFTGQRVAGDLLVAIIVCPATPEGPAGFTALTETSGDYNVGVYTKISDGTETTLGNSISNSQVATIAFRSAKVGIGANGASPSIANDRGDMTVVIAGADSQTIVNDNVPPAGYEFIFNHDNYFDGTFNNLVGAYNPYAGEDQDPGAWATENDGADVYAIFSVKGA